MVLDALGGTKSWGGRGGELYKGEVFVDTSMLLGTMLSHACHYDRCPNVLSFRLTFFQMTMDFPHTDKKTMLCNVSKAAARIISKLRSSFSISVVLTGLATHICLERKRTGFG